MTSTVDMESTLLEIIDISDLNDNNSIYNATIENFHKICRFCLGFEDVKPFFQMTYERVSVQNIIFNCLSLKVDSEDHLPYNLCQSCLTELIRYYKFRKRCFQTTKVLEDAYNRHFMTTKQTATQSDNSECCSTSIENLAIKEEQIEYAPTIHNEYILPDIDLTIKNEHVVDIHDDSFDDLNNLMNKNKEIDDSSITVSDNISEKTTCNIIDDDIVPQLHACKCKQISCSKLALISHMKNHISKKPYTCSVCERSFTKELQMNRHMLIHTGSRPHQSSMFKKSFITKSELVKTHMLNHSSRKSYKCSVCVKSFVWKSNLSKHMLIHKTEGRYKCTICMQTFDQISIFNAHILTHNSARLENSYLDSHNDHNTKKQHKCGVCMKCFTRKSTLNVHMLIHKDERLHQCKVCLKSFIQKQNLNVHMLIHTGERPHKCSVCPKSFRRKGDIDRHMLIHKGERPHKCNVCMKSFIRKSSFNRHLLLHNPERLQ